MKYLLDTNICIEWLNGRDRALARKVGATAPSDIGSCSVVRAELLFGARASQRPAENLRRVEAFWRHLVSLPFDDAAADQAGEIRAQLTSMGKPIGPNDLLISAVARSRGLIVVTRNDREFSRVLGLAVEVW
jgi:tRNA(fMet)-specific endonuclease VapC